VAARGAEPVAGGVLTVARGLLGQAIDAVRVAMAGATDEELVALLGLCEGAARRLDRVTVDAVADLERRGVFAARGYRTTASALADLLGWERFEARRRTLAAEQVTARIGLDGTVLPARLPATAEVFAAGAASLRHVEVIAGVLDSGAARRLSTEQWAGVEEQLAAKADTYTPSELRAWGTQLVELLDQDGPAPDDGPRPLVNELRLTKLPGGGGKIVGRSIATVVDAKARPLTGEDHRPAAERQAEALAEVCGWVLDHGDATVVPECGGHRPHLNVLIRLDDLQNRARAACLDFGGQMAPEAVRMLCCDARVVPVVMNGTGQPLDVGRATRTIPDGLRRAVAARDKGCAHPGCDRPPSWCEIHHVLAWEQGGETKLSNLVMLCRQHHRETHFTEWVVRIRDGLPEFLPPSFVDPLRTPRRTALPQLVGVVA
jgi:5-methylcytosine-specific restriction protein A